MDCTDGFVGIAGSIHFRKWNKWVSVLYCYSRETDTPFSQIPAETGIELQMNEFVGNKMV